MSYWERNLRRRTMTRRGVLKVSAAGAGAAFLAACGGDSGSNGLTIDEAAGAREPGSVWFAKDDYTLPDETEQAVRGGIYRGVLEEDQSGNFDAITLMSSQVPFSQHVHELLMARNRGPGIDPSSLEASNPTGALAESWEIAPDGSSITFTMRQGVKFHDIAPVNGRVMDMDDWKTSQERHLEVGVYRNAIEEILDKAEFPDSRHMVWKLKFPFAPIFDRIYHDKFAFPIQPKELNADPNLAAATAIGTGYKVVESYEPSIGFKFRKHPEYWGGDPFIEQWHQPLITEYSNRYAQFVQGNVIDFTPTARDVLQLHRDVPGAVILAAPIPDNSCTRMRWGRMNPGDQIWADPRVRVAARRSIDFQKIGEFLSNKAAFEAEGIPVELSPMTHLPQNPGYWMNPEKGELGKLSANYMYDVAEAKKLTAAAGHSGPIPLPYYVALEQGAIPEEDLLVLDSLNGAGTFALEVNQTPTRTEHNKYRIEGRYDGLIPQSGSTDDADYFVMRDYHRDGRVGSRGLQNQAYPDPRMDALGEAQRREMDVQKRQGILKEFQTLAAELMPAVPGRHLYTVFHFRWPWVHNLAHGTTWGAWTGVSSPVSGQPVLGGHLQWLSKDMPNRDTPS